MDRRPFLGMITSAPTSRIAALQRASYSLNDELYARYAERDADRVSDLLQVLMRGGDELFEDGTGAALFNALRSLESFGRQQVDMADAPPIGTAALELDSEYSVAELDNVAETLTGASSREGVRALALRATHGWSWDEISADTGLSVRSAKARARNAGKAIAAGATGRTKLVGCGETDSALAKAIFGDYNETSEKECQLVDEFLEHQTHCGPCHELYVTLVRACHIAAALLPPLAPQVGTRQNLAAKDDAPGAEFPPDPVEPVLPVAFDEATEPDLPTASPEPPSQDISDFEDLRGPAEDIEPYYDPVFAAVYESTLDAAPTPSAAPEDEEPAPEYEALDEPEHVEAQPAAVAAIAAGEDAAAPVFFDQDSESEQDAAPDFAFSIAAAAVAARDLIPGSDDDTQDEEPAAAAPCNDARDHDASIAALAAEAETEPALTEAPYESWAADREEREISLARATAAAAPAEPAPAEPVAEVVSIEPTEEIESEEEIDSTPRPNGVKGVGVATAVVGLREAKPAPEVPILAKLPPLPPEYVNRYSGEGGEPAESLEDAMLAEFDAKERRFERRAIAVFAAALLLFFAGFLGIGSLGPGSKDKPVAQAPTPATGKPASDKKTKKPHKKARRRHKKHAQRPAPVYVPQQTTPVVQSQPAPAPKASSGGVDDGSAEFLPEERG